MLYQVSPRLRMVDLFFVLEFGEVVLKYALVIHADSEESDNSLDYSRTFTTTINNPVIRELFQKQVKLISRINRI